MQSAAEHTPSPPVGLRRAGRAEGAQRESDEHPQLRHFACAVAPLNARPCPARHTRPTWAPLGEPAPGCRARTAAIPPNPPPPNHTHPPPPHAHTHHPNKALPGAAPGATHPAPSDNASCSFGSPTLLLQQRQEGEAVDGELKAAGRSTRPRQRRLVLPHPLQRGPQVAPPDLRACGQPEGAAAGMVGAERLVCSVGKGRSPAPRWPCSCGRGRRPLAAHTAVSRRPPPHL